MDEEDSKSGNFSVVASRESTLASRPPLDRLCDGVRCCEPECIECGMAIEAAFSKQCGIGMDGTTEGEEEGGPGGGEGAGDELKLKARGLR